MFCVHPVHAADFKTPTKRVEAVDMCVDHLILPGTVAAGEFGLDYHRVQTAEGRTRSKEFLSLLVKKTSDGWPAETPPSGAACPWGPSDRRRGSQ